MVAHARTHQEYDRGVLLFLLYLQREADAVGGGVGMWTTLSSALQQNLRHVARLEMRPSPEVRCTVLHRVAPCFSAQVLKCSSACVPVL